MRRWGVIDRFASCFHDGRSQGLIEDATRTLVGQRVLGIALGHEDLVDHDDLRHDPVLAAVMGKLTPRRKECAALAGKSTLSRLEHAPEEGVGRAPPRYHKISHDGAAIERTFVDIALRSARRPPPVMVIDLDAGRRGTSGWSPRSRASWGTRRPLPRLQAARRVCSRTSCGRHATAGVASAG